MQNHLDVHYWCMTNIDFTAIHHELDHYLHAYLLPFAACYTFFFKIIFI